MKTVLITLIVNIFITINTNAQVDSTRCISYVDSLSNHEYHLFVDSIAKPRDFTLIQLLTKIQIRKKSETLNGKVVVEFIVKPDGRIVNEKISKCIADDKYYAKQYLKLIKSVEWQPAYCGGEKVSYKFTLPINIDFQLDE